jgi:hypothetical protein
MATKPPKKNGLSADLEKMLSGMLKEAMEPATQLKAAMSVTDKMKVIDRCLKFESIKAKMEDGGGFGSGFDD